MQLARNPFFSIIIPTLNEERDLPKLLQDLTDQTYSNFEVIHVDGHSEDKTVTKAAKFAKKIDLQTLTVDKRNVSYQRNFGAKKARGEWIIFMDADNRLPNYFLDGIRYQVAKQKVDLFTTWADSDKKSSASRVISNATNAALELYHLMNKEVAFGAMIGVHHTVIPKVQFDEKQMVAEDTLFVQAAIKLGFVFSIFREPRYVYSLRRLRKEGTLKMVTTTAKLQLRFLQGKDFSTDNVGYSMQGGAYYHQTRYSLIESLHTFIQRATKKQIAQARQIMSSLKDEIFE